MYVVIVTLPYIQCTLVNAYGDGLSTKQQHRYLNLLFTKDEELGTCMIGTYGRTRLTCADKTQ